MKIFAVFLILLGISYGGVLSWGCGFWIWASRKDGVASVVFYSAIALVMIPMVLFAGAIFIAIGVDAWSFK